MCIVSLTISINTRIMCIEHSPLTHEPIQVCRYPITDRVTLPGVPLKWWRVRFLQEGSMQSNKPGECPEILQPFPIALPDTEPVPGYPLMCLLNKPGGYLK